MAFFTVSADAEGGLAIVAGTAGLALLHIWHGKAGSFGSSGINSAMTIITLE